ncbi:PREDICTED: CDK5 regulatory subunit-associated protein 3, partial [Chaetura pelagica]|uniref:CDK5 regulatory subunit-associated protein 3 n=1 Tax=Chaetura pelagica TaxID=8897 RepID=UPI000523A451
GDNVRQELLALVKDLPSQLAGVGEGDSGLSEAIELYQACVEFVCESPAEPVVPLLRHVGRRGNSTVYEWRRGLQPLRVERPPLEEPPEPPGEDTFLSQRLVEMEEEADVVAVSQFQLAPPVLQGQTSARVGSLLGSTRALLGQLCTPSLQHLFIILASPRYVERVTELLGQKLKQAELL